MDNQLSYAQFLKNRDEFRKSGKRSGHEFNLLDSPGHKFFKIMFYFGDESIDSYKNGFSCNGLLHPTWEIYKSLSYTEELIDDPIALLEMYDYNSAWTFLKINDENERADKLEKFVNLLSNINSYSPWYFTSISGLDSAIERSGPDSDKIEIGERKKLTITCLPDAFDNRITTLLDLYRDITWSWSQKRQILPSNLKKFDMAIYIFESPIMFWHDVEDTEIDSASKYHYKPSYKMIEFHDCEFSYNSAKSGWGEMNNQTGFNPTYTIEISYGDCYEISYNEHVMRTIGDVIATDTYQAVISDGANISNMSYTSTAQDDNSLENQFQTTDVRKRINLPSSSKHPFAGRFNPNHLIYSFGNLETDESTRESTMNNGDHEFKGRSLPPHSNFTDNRDYSKDKNTFTPGFLGNAIGQGVGYVTDYVKEKLARAVLGNLYTYSLTKIGTQLGELEKGNLIKSGQSIKQYIDETKERENETNKEAPSGNIGTGYYTYIKEKPEGELYDSTPESFKGYGKDLGNIEYSKFRSFLGKNKNLSNKISPASIANN